MAERWDVIIVGSGAGGATLAWSLASTGKRVLIVERGDWLPRERENWDASAVIGGRYRTRERWLDARGEPFAPYTHYWVGGNTKMYGAALLRLRDHDFDDVQHHDGVSPAWPISYRDLEPWYAQAEALYQVHGARGSDPHEPWAAGDYPHPPVPHEPRIARLAEELRGQGLRPFPLPLGLRMPERGRCAPVALSLFDGFPDPTGTKSDAQVCALEPALAHSNVAIRTGTFAERIVTDRSGRAVIGVAVRAEHDRDGAREILEADVVVVACGAIGSAALFLRSACDAHPRGLANGSGLVGRNYMTHQNGALIWVSRRTVNDARFQKTLGLTDWYRGEGGELPAGAVQLMGRSDPSDLASLAAGVIEDQTVSEIAERSIDFWLTAEDLPSPDNCVQLRDGVVQIVYRRNNQEAYRRLRAGLERVLRTIEPDSRVLGYELGVAGVSHQNGTLRFGHDPATSVLDPLCRTHEVENLYCVDASFFPSCGAVNPSLTIMANALRVGAHISERLS